MEIRDLFSTLNVSSRALNSYQAQIAVTAENLANANTTRTQEGTPYKRKVLLRRANVDRGIFRQLMRSRMGLRTSAPGHLPQAILGMRPNAEPGLVDLEQEVVERPQFRRVYQPGHPDADEAGYVEYPDVNVVMEMLELITASRAYEANLTVMNTAKTLARRAMEI